MDAGGVKRIKMHLELLIFFFVSYFPLPGKTNITVMVGRASWLLHWLHGHMLPKNRAGDSRGRHSVLKFH